MKSVFIDYVGTLTSQHRSASSLESEFSTNAIITGGNGVDKSGFYGVSVEFRELCVLYVSSLFHFLIDSSSLIVFHLRGIFGKSDFEGDLKGHLHSISLLGTLFTEIFNTFDFACQLSKGLSYWN